MPLYESTFYRASRYLVPSRWTALPSSFREILTEAGGEIAKDRVLGACAALRIASRRTARATTYFMNINAPPEAINAMERTMRINEDVIRYLTVRVEEHDPNPAPLTQSRGRGRDGRGGRGGRWEGRRREDGEDRGAGRDRGRVPASARTPHLPRQSLSRQALRPA